MITGRAHCSWLTALPTLRDTWPGVLLSLMMMVVSWPAVAQDRFLSLRNHNPFLQIFGLPRFQSAELVPAGENRTIIALDIANHADDGGTATEATTLDGESTALLLSWRRGWTERLELGLELPVISHNGGILDSGIERWHDLFGLSNANRSGPGNRLRFAYANSGPGFELNSPVTAPGDLQLSAAYSVASSARGNHVTLRSSIKLPSGDSDRLGGSGAPDFALGLYATDNSFAGSDRLSVSAIAGLLVLGEGDVLPDIQKDTVGFGGISGSWIVSGGLAVHTQLYGQSAYYASDLDEIGGNSVQLSLGGSYRPAGSRFAYSFGVVEDLFSDATTDVAFHFSIQVR